VAQEIKKMTISQRILVPFYSGQRQVPPPFDRNRHQTSEARILACSAVDRSQQRLFAAREFDRKLCEDRKTPLEHLLPGSLAKSVSLFR
jgi:hypothetical protein